MLYLPTADVRTIPEQVPLGECCGQIFDQTQQQQYLTAGGVIYPRVELPNAVRLAPKSIAKQQQAAVIKQSRGGQSQGMMQLLSYAVRPLKYLMFPKVAVLPEVLLRRQAKVCVGAMAFHPHAMLLAVSISSQHSDECVIHMYDVSHNNFTDQTLRHGFQHKVTCLAWKPKSKAVLAVGCEGGALIWDLNFTMGACQSFTVESLAERRKLMGTSFVPGRDAPELFQSLPEELHEVESGAALFFPLSGGGASGKNNAVVTQVTFSHNSGRFLAMGSSSDRTIRVYDVSVPPNNGLIATLHSLDGGCRCLTFSSDDRYLVMAPHGSTKLRVWDTSSWKSWEYWVSAEVTAIEPLPVQYTTDENDYYWEADTIKGYLGAQFLLAFDKTEGLAIVEVRNIKTVALDDLDKWNDDQGVLSRGVEVGQYYAGRAVSLVAGILGCNTQLKLIGRISLNALVQGQQVGGSVVNIAAHLCSTAAGNNCGARVSCELEDGHVVSFHISHCSSRTTSSRSGILLDANSFAGSSRAAQTSIPATNYFVRGVGVFYQGLLFDTPRTAQELEEQNHGIVSMKYFSGFENGSLLAILLSNGEVSFLPSYYKI